MTQPLGKTSCSLYHVAKPGVDTVLSDGYVGISCQVGERWKRHKAGHSGSTVLGRAYKKYGNLKEEVLLEASRETCLYFEMLLRPEPSMGWNLTEGGGLPPSHKGKVMSQTQKDNIGAANSGNNSYKWKGYWVVDGVRHISLHAAAKSLSCSHKTVYNRVKSDKFPTWTFEESPHPTFRQDD